VVYNSDTVFLYGTFRSCPKLYHQLFTVHCAINQSYVPLAYILLHLKTSQSCLQAFQHLVVECKIMTYNSILFGCMPILKRHSNSSYSHSSGDYNAKHQSWGCRVNNPRGLTLYNFINSKGFKVLAQPGPTY